MPVNINVWVLILPAVPGLRPQATMTEVSGWAAAVLGRRFYDAMLDASQKGPRRQIHWAIIDTWWDGFGEHFLGSFFETSDTAIAEVLAPVMGSIT